MTPRARLLATALLAVFAATPIATVVATDAYAISAPAAQNFVLSLGNQALTTLNNKTLDKNTVRRTLETMFSDNVDVDWVSRFVMGRNWRTLTPEQQTSYKAAYRDFLIKHYTANFVEYTQGTTFRVTRATALPRDEQLVTSEILRPGKPAVLLEYRIRQKPDMPKAKVIDILVEGVSLITTQREEFNAVMQRNGIDHLIAQLKARAAAADQKASQGAAPATKDTASN